MTGTELQHIIDDLATHGARSGAEDQIPPPTREHEAARAVLAAETKDLVALADERRSVDAQRDSVRRILGHVRDEAEAAQAEQRYLTQRLRDIEAVAGLGVPGDATREEARQAELEQRVRDLDEQRERLDALETALAARLDDLDCAIRDARARMDAARQEAERALPTDLCSRIARGEAITLQDIVPEGNGHWAIYLRAADGATYRLRDGGDYVADAERVRDRRARKEWAPRSGMLIPADGQLTTSDVAAILARTVDGPADPQFSKDRPGFRFQGASMTYVGSQGEPRYRVVVLDGQYAVELASYAQFERLCGYAQPATARA